MDGAALRLRSRTEGTLLRTELRGADGAAAKVFVP
jgi:flagellar basal body P-ring protein FlgI